MRQLAVLAVLMIAPHFADAQELNAQDAVAEVGIFGAARTWQTAYRSRAGVFTYGLSGGAMLNRWLEVQGTIDHARRSSTPEGLQITNSETWLAAGPRFSLWVDFVRFFAEASAAGVIRTSSYRESADARAVRGSFGYGLGGGLTFAIANRVGLSLRGNWRRRDDQAHMIFALDVSWLFHPTQ